MPDAARLDLLLKNTGIVPRRTVAKRACDQGLVELNGVSAKAAASVKVGDTITVRVGMKVTRHEVLQIPARAVPKSHRGDYVGLISTEKVELDI